MLWPQKGPHYLSNLIIVTTLWGTAPHWNTLLQNTENCQINFDYESTSRQHAQWCVTTSNIIVMIMQYNEYVIISICLNIVTKYVHAGNNLEMVFRHLDPLQGANIAPLIASQGEKSWLWGSFIESYHTASVSEHPSAANLKWFFYCMLAHLGMGLASIWV